jgi:Zn-dependent peptidase ImmA (M78 family)
MMKSIIVEVKPEVLKWLRESSGWTPDELSKRLRTTPDTILEFETGKKPPTLTQLKEMSILFKRPLASFLLSKPKQDKPLPKDYRFLPNRTGIFDRKTLLAIRRARSLQNISKELSINIRYETEARVERVKLSDNPDTVAKKYREIFDLSFEKQRKFKDAYKFFGYLRDVLEDSNILVFQFSMPIEDARGFALADDLPSIIVINSKDSIEARLFTLMHEFGHIILGETVIDIPDESLTDRDSIEKWCNKFASSFLLPKESSRELFMGYSTKLTETESLNSLSRRYKVSKAVLLVRMLELNYISKEEFDRVMSRYALKEPKTKPEKGKKVLGLKSDQKCLSEMGNKFISLVANNFDRDFITYSDALSYLSIKSKNFDKVLAKARK